MLDSMSPVPDIIHCSPDSSRDTLLRHARSQHLGTQPHEHPAHGNSGPTSPPISDPVSHLATLEKPATDQVCASIDSIIPAPEQVLPELQFSSLDHDSNTATTPSLVHSPQHVDVRAPTTRNLPENDNNSVPAFLTYRQGQLNSARLLMTWRGPAELELQLLLGPRDLSSWVLRR